ncbi:MAG: hypothetical protein ACXVB4_13730 [Pseudobdellovibrionaceae bacterium]
MKYLYWIVIALVLVIGVSLSMYLGQETVSLPKLAYNQYDNPDQFVEALMLKMTPELKSSPLVMLGVMPGRKTDLEIWKSFLNRAESTDLKYQALVVDPELPFVNELFPRALKIDLKNDLERFINGVKNAQAQGLRVAVIVPSIYASQLLQNNPVDSIKKNFGIKPVSFSIIGFPRAMDQEASMEIPCVMGDNDREGVGALGCAVQKKARLLYRQKSKPGFYEGLIDQIGEKDYLVLFNTPS